MNSLWKQTLALWYFGFTKIPLILFVRPKINVLDQEQCILTIPLRRRTKNHLNSLYFGALAVGADLACGLLAMHIISNSKRSISLVFKDVQADFLKRVDSDAVFSCVEGQEILTLIQNVIESGERQHKTLKIQVTSPEKYGDEVLATFSLTLSLKEKSKK